MLAEWHQTPEYFLEHWTDEQFEAFWQARNQRMLAVDRALSDTRNSPQTPAGSRRVADYELFHEMGIAPQGTA